MGFKPGLYEDPEGVKWELGFGQIFTGKMGFGITDRKTIELGLGFLKFGKTIGWEMGFGQNLGWENGIYTPLQDPLIYSLRCTALRATLKQLYPATVTGVNLVDSLYASLTSHLLVPA